jgi:hypothetical protein
MKQFSSRWRRESGAVVVHVVVALTALVAFSALTIDYGVMWMSRRQAQNAADSAALAGAISLAYDNPTDWDRARASAEDTGEANEIFGAAPDIIRGAGFGTDVLEDISFPESPSDSCPSGGPLDTCVRVNVYRTTAGNTLGGGAPNPLPTFFATLFGRTTQGVRATATAQLRAGNATTCLRPWAVADKWEENVRCTNPNAPNCPGWTANDTWDLTQSFDKWNRTGNPPTLDPAIPASGNLPDEYRAPETNGPTDPGTGFGLYNPDGSIKDFGQPIKLKLGGNNDRISSGWFLALDLSGECIAEDCPGNSGAQMYKFAIQNCVGGTVGIGDTLPVETGNMAGPTGQGVYRSTGNDPLSLVERDPNARWDPVNKEIDSSCAPGTCADGESYLFSPRIVPVALFDIDAYLGAGYNGSNGQVTITNVMGFFVMTAAEALQVGLQPGNGNPNDEVYGVMVAVPGMTTNTENNTSSFLVTVRLVR